MRAVGRATGGGLLAALLLTACAPCERQAHPRPGAGEFSVMTFNVFRFCSDDRDRDGQADDPKPAVEVEAVVRIIRDISPDVLAVQEMGTREEFDGFCRLLRDRGLDYRHVEYVPAAVPAVSLAIASRFPIVARASVTDETYTVSGTPTPVQRGFAVVDIEPAPGYRFRLMNAHLKSKRFHELGQTEMRRNEARILNRLARESMAREPELNLLVVGDMNDTPRSDPIRELRGEPPDLYDLRPCDYLGDLWTHFYGAEDSYERLDYMLVSPAMWPEVVTNKCFVVRHPRNAAASDHRPVVATFRSGDAVPAGPSERDQRPGDGAGTDRTR